MLLPCPAPIRWIPLRDWQHQAPFHNSALVKVHIVKLEEIGRMWVACSPCCKINLASYPEIRAGVFSWVNLLHWFWLEQRPFCASAIPAWGGVSQERLLTAYKCVVSSWGATEGMVGFRVLVQSSADTSSTLLPPTWFLWVFMSAVSCLSLTSSAFIKDLTVAWFVLCSEMFWGLPRVYFCVILKLLKIFNVPTWGVLKAKASAWGNSASCAGAGKSCFSGNILKGCILQESHSAHTELSPCVMEGLSCPCPLQPSLYWRPPLFLDVRTWKVWNYVVETSVSNWNRWCGVWTVGGGNKRDE